MHGFATVELPLGLRIADVAVHISHGKRWASLPSKPMLNSDGQQLRDERGKGKWSSILEWKSEKLRLAFSDRVVEIVSAAHPEDLAP